MKVPRHQSEAHHLALVKAQCESAERDLWGAVCQITDLIRGVRRIQRWQSIGLAVGFTVNALLTIFN